MAYSFNLLTSAYRNGLKYVWTGTDKNNLTVKLEIYEKDANINTPTEIRGLQSIRLHVQGSQGAVTAPIVKTSLEFTLADAPDLSTTGVKAGDWQEFFSPDATKYLVVLRRWYNTLAPEDGDEYPPYCWLGYITPDTWREGLSYHSSITITARDNLGHLQDFTFDAQGDQNGLIQVSSLIDQALTKIAFPFSLENPTTGDASYLKDTSGKSLTASYVAVSLFEDQTWYDALERVLESLGLCLRWYEGGDFYLQPIRNLPLRANTSRTSAASMSAELRFFGGNRMKDPAFKEITEIVDFKSEAVVELDLKRNLTIGTTATTYNNGKRYDERTHSWVTYTGRSFQNTDTDAANDGGWINTYGFLDGARCQLDPRQAREEGAAGLESGVFLAADFNTNTSGPKPTYRMAANSTDIKIRCRFGRPVVLKNTTAPYTVARTWSFLKTACITISYIPPGSSTRYYWNGSGWQTTYVLLEIPVAEGMADEYGFEVALTDIGGTASLGGWLDLEFSNFITEEESHSSSNFTFYGSFVWLTSLETELNSMKILKQDKVRTINDTAYNVMVDRKPTVGAMSAVVPYFSPENYPGALWVYNSGKADPYAYANYWNGFNASTAIPLPAQIHKQLLCYNHEALTTLEGSCDIQYALAPLSLRLEFAYKGKHFILQSGTIDVLGCQFTSALFHEYIWYPDLFNENNNPPYSGAPVYRGKVSNTSTVMQSSGGGGGGGGQGGGGVTSATASVDANVGTPSVNVNFNNGVLDFAFHNLKGETGATGPQGPAGPTGPQGPAGGGLSRVGLTMPTAFQVSGSPLTQNGTIAVTLKSTYVIPSKEQTQKWTAASDAVYNIGTLLAAPIVKRFRVQYNSTAVLNNDQPSFFVRHPLLELNEDAEICLMVHRKRNGSGGPRKNHRQGWFLACGKGHAASAAYIYTPTNREPSVCLSQDDILDGIARTYCQIIGQAGSQSYSSWLSRVRNVSSVYFGFSGDPLTMTRTVKKIHFGLAVRIPNPEFALVVNPNQELKPDTGSIAGVPRYIYSNVAPLTARMYAADADNGLKKGSIVFEMH